MNYYEEFFFYYQENNKYGTKLFFLKSHFIDITFSIYKIMLTCRFDVLRKG